MKKLLYSLLICIPVCAMEPSSDSGSEKGIHSRLSLMPYIVNEPGQDECEVEEMYNFLTKNGIGTNQKIVSRQLFRSNSDSSLHASSTASSRRASSSTQGSIEMVNGKNVVEESNKKRPEKTRSFHEGPTRTFSRFIQFMSPSARKKNEKEDNCETKALLSGDGEKNKRPIPKKIKSLPGKLSLSELAKQEQDEFQNPHKLTPHAKRGISASDSILPGLSSVSKGEDKLRQEKRKTEYKEIIALYKRYNAEKAINFLSDFGEESASLSASQLKTITKMLISSVEIVLAEERKIKFLSVVLNKLIKTQENYPEIGKLLSENDNDAVLFYPVVKDLRSAIACKNLADHAKKVLANTQST